MALPVPEPGLVISHAYLWRYEHIRGLEEGRKQRPCVIILCVEQQGGRLMVSVAPVTHREPDDLSAAVEIPLAVKRHLGLDDQRSFVITTEINQFQWPGFDLRPISPDVSPGGQLRFDYGFLPPRLFETIRLSMLGHIARREGVVVRRD